MRYEPDNPLIVQSDHTLLLETLGPRAPGARADVARFAELVKSPEYVHLWRLTPLSLWNAAAAGLSADGVVAALERWSRYEVPPGVPAWVRGTMGRFGRLRLQPADGGIELVADEPALMRELRAHRKLKPLLGPRRGDRAHAVDPAVRGDLKQALITLGHPVVDLAGFVDGAPLPMSLRADRRRGGPWGLRPYQEAAVDAFFRADPGGADGGSGVVVLPCGAGKTLVGAGVMARLGMRTLILCTSTTALRQWRDELLDRTTLEADELGEYTGAVKDLRPVTLTTYQMLTWRRSRDAPFAHFSLFDRDDWGLVIYDEVHLLPAPVFRAAARIQARRRLGLTATLVREDGLEGDVFALIGPRRFDVPWRDLERQGWIASAKCVELRMPLDSEARIGYATAGDRDQHRIAACAPGKAGVVRAVVEAHPGAPTLVIGMYLDQLEVLAEELGAPLITGDTPQDQRDALYAQFREGRLPVLVLSRVGNFSVDLPDARVCVQVSGAWGSRQEEAQRLGRVLRPKADGGFSWFYTVVTLDTVEQAFAERRQVFLAEQGYSYEARVVHPGDRL